MIRTKPRLLSAALALTVAFGVLVATPAEAAVPAPIAEECTDVSAVFARGSGQTVGQADAEAEKFLDALTEHVAGSVTLSTYELGSKKIYGWQYPAIAVEKSFPAYSDALGAGFSAGDANNYGESVDMGANELTKYLNGRAAACPKTQFVLGGYSQGAQVINEAYSHSTVNDKLRGRIVYNALFGDPKLYLPEGIMPYPAICAGHGKESEWRFNVPNCYVNNGSLIGRRPYLPDGWTDRTGLWCNNNDFVCGGLRGISLPFNSGHFTYGDELGPISEAVDEIARRLKSSLPRAKAASIKDVVVDKTMKAGTSGLDVVFLIDSTNSMQFRIDGAKKFASTMAKKIKEQRGRVALVEFRDDYATPPAQTLSGLRSDTDEFERKLAGIDTKGNGYNDLLEAQLHGLMTAFNTLDWRDGATKAAVILTDAGFKDPDPIDGSTVATVAARALAIDPVNVYVVAPSRMADRYAELTRETTGAFIPDDTGDSAVALQTALTKIAERPVALIAHPEYFVAEGGTIRYDVSKSYGVGSGLVSYDWDFDGDGVFEVLGGAPVVEHVYAEKFDGTMQARVTDANGAVSNISAFVHVGTTPASRYPDAPTALTAELTANAKSGAVTLDWLGVDERVESWLVSVDGIYVGRLPADGKTAKVGEVQLTRDTVFSVQGLDKDGELGAAAFATVKARDVPPQAKSKDSEKTIGQIILPYLIWGGGLLLLLVAIVVTLIVWIRRRLRRHTAI